MKYTRTFIIALLITTTGCNEVDSVKKSAEVSKEITEANHAIDENLKKIEESEPNRRESKNVDGPYPADEYSLTPSGEFYFLVMYTDGKDSTWLTIRAKSENDILKMYPKLEVYKVKPKWIAQDDWSDIRRKCLKQNMIFDLRDESKGWLLDHKERLK
jgi:hypothetical protein